MYLTLGMLDNGLRPLGVICDQGGITPRWYKELEARRLVPGWLKTRSRGRGKGRAYLYPWDEALAAIQKVKNLQAQGMTLAQISKKCARWWHHGGEHFEKDYDLEKLVRKELKLKDRAPRRAFMKCVQTAAQLGAFSDFDLVAG